MSTQRKIVQKLFESKGLCEAEFKSGGSTYKCVFGKYYKDGETIDRDAYFAAKEKAGGDSASNSTKSVNLEIPKVDYSDLGSARKGPNGTPLFDDVKDALKYEKRKGNHIRQQNGITNDQEAEEFCSALKNKLVNTAKETGKLVDRNSNEYQILKAVASTLKGHTISGYGMTSAYTDIKKSSPYSFTSMTNEVEGKESKPKKTPVKKTGFQGVR